MEMLALQVSLGTQPIFDPHTAREWIKAFEPAEIAPVPEEENTDGTNHKKPAKQDKSVAPSLGIISKMADSGLLDPASE